MSIAIRKSSSNNFLFNAIFKLERAIEARRLYNETYHELNRLSERELLDLNLCRADLERVAKEAVAQKLR